MRRFWRADLVESGHLEIYALAPYPGTSYTSLTETQWYASTISERWLRNVNREDPNDVDAIALMVIAEIVSILSIRDFCNPRPVN